MPFLFKPSMTRLTVGISQHDVRTLAAQFQGHPLQVGLRSRRLDNLPDLGGPGEGDLVHVHVACDGRAGCGSISRDDVQYTGWEASLEQTTRDCLNLECPRYPGIGYGNYWDVEPRVSRLE